MPRIQQINSNHTVRFAGKNAVGIFWNVQCIIYQKVQHQRKDNLIEIVPKKWVKIDKQRMEFIEYHSSPWMLIKMIAESRRKTENKKYRQMFDIGTAPGNLSIEAPFQPLLQNQKFPSYAFPLVFNIPSHFCSPLHNQLLILFQQTDSFYFLCSWKSKCLFLAFMIWIVEHIIPITHLLDLFQ